MNLLLALMLFVGCDWLGEFRGMAVVTYDDGQRVERAILVRDDAKAGFTNHWDMFFFPTIQPKPIQRTRVTLRANMDGTITAILDGYAHLRITPADRSVRKELIGLFWALGGAAIDKDGGRWQIVSVVEEDGSSRMHLPPEKGIK